MKLIDQQDDVDLTKIAQMMAFEDYKSLAAYMGAHGYYWSRAKNKTARQASKPVVKPTRMYFYVNIWNCKMVCHDCHHRHSKSL